MNIKDLATLLNVLANVPSDTTSEKPSDTPAGGQSHCWKVGEKYFIRTVTHHVTGRLIHVGEHELTLVDAAWIADDGRFSPAVASGDFNEVEPFPDGKEVLVGRAALIDAVIIPKLPREQK